MKPAASILITGASSGIGEALALACARRGAGALFLCGRNAERLASVAARCREAGCAMVNAKVLDVTDADALTAWIEECDAARPLEVVFANAGVGTGPETTANVRRTFSIDLMAAVNTALAAIDIYRHRPTGRRQIVLTASIAGYAPLSTCPAYAGAKAGLKSWGLSLRGHLRREGIRVNVLCPGFIRSRLTDRNTCPMPFFMEADRAARTILDRVDRDVGLIAFPWPMRLAVWALAATPWRLAEFIAGLLPAKNAQDARGITL